jgi:hypothetical protein
MEESLVLTDTAPVAISAETEYLARFVDCAIVVIESGVTTRAQLRAAAQALQRIDVATVGFVLNRVGLAKADPAFRNSVNEVERHLRSQSRSPARRTVRSHHFAAEAAPNAGQIPREAAVRRPPEAAVPKPASAPLRATPERASVPANPTPTPLPPPTPRMPQAQVAAQSALQPDTDMPWWLSEARRQPDAAAAEQARQPDAEEALLNTPSRLSGLRDVLFSRVHNNPDRSGEFEREEEAMPPLENETQRPVYGEAFVPYPESQPAPVSATPTHVIAPPEFLPPKTTTASLDRGRSWEEGTTARRDRRDPFDEVAILPSWHGQYRKKD